MWDRGALVALRPEDREDYVGVCDRVLAPGGKVLLATMVYDQSAKKGADDVFVPLKTPCLEEVERTSQDLMETFFVYCCVDPTNTFQSSAGKMHVRRAFESVPGTLFARYLPL